MPLVGFGVPFDGHVPKCQVQNVLLGQAVVEPGGSDARRVDVLDQNVPEDWRCGGIGRRDAGVCQRAGEPTRVPPNKAATTVWAVQSARPAGARPGR